MQSHWTFRAKTSGIVAWLGALILWPAQMPAAENNLLASVPLDPAVIQMENWETTLDTSIAIGVVDDEILGRKVLEFQKIPPVKRGKAPPPFIIKSKDPVSGPYSIQALVRFPNEIKADAKGRPGRGGTKMILSFGTGTDPEKPGPAYILEGGTGGNNFTFAAKRGASKASVESDKPWGGSGSLTPNISVDQVSPLAKENVRLELEASLAKLPVPHSTWIPVRIEMGMNRVRMYFNGALVADETHTEDSAGPVMMEIRDTMRLAGLEIHRLEKSHSSHVQVPLETHYNARGSIDLKSLDQPLNNLKIQGIPFSLVGGLPNDHVDIGQSIFRYRLGTHYTADYDHRRTTPNPNQLDPTRLMFSVPARAYTKAWILAGADDVANKSPIFTIRFFKPNTGWATDAATMVPTFTAKTGPEQAHPVKVKTTKGQDTSLWLVPIELDSAELAADFRGGRMSIELTKEVKPNVAWPDPNNYSYQAGGLPSSVRLYGLTLEDAPVWAFATGDVHGNTYADGEQPNWVVTIRNQTEGKLPVLVKLDITDPYGTSLPSMEKKLTLKPGEEQTPSFQPKTQKYGLHTVKTTLSAGNWSQSREGKLLTIPKVSRKATGATSPWGVWQWNGGHTTHPVMEDNARLLNLLGAISHFKLEKSEKRGEEPINLNDFRKKYSLGAENYRIIPRALPAWSAKNPIDPADYEAYKEQIGQTAKKLIEKHPDFQYANCFAENSISMRLTHGMPAWALGQPEFEYTATEAARIKQYTATAMAGGEGIRKHAPKVKFIFGHCAAPFPLPFLKEKDWNPDVFDGFGMDLPQFERMPERQPRATEPSLLYFFYKAMQEDPRLKGKEIIHLESYYPASHELALGHRGQANSVVRTAVLSLALGTTKFLDTWTLDDCADRWGNQHYGCSGLISRVPESNPKPAAAAFATMTRILDLAKYDGWMDTGSRSAFCIRFKDTDRLIYAVWTFRGSRPLEITPEPGAKVVNIDENGNEVPLQMADGKPSVMLSPTPSWIVVTQGSLQSAKVGPAVYEEAPGELKIVLDDFEKADWKYDAAPFNRYASNNWDMAREPVEMKQARIQSDERNSTVWRVEMAKRTEGKPCIGNYGVFTPPKPILIPGKAEAVGLYVKGASQWHRLLYELEDAKGEKWLSCGVKNAWNSDDIHSWSYLNYDGWRYMEFPLPANAPGDDYREKSSYSWGPDDDGVVNLPLKLTKIIVEMRTDMVYVNELLPVEDLSVEIDDLVAVYSSQDNMTDKPIKLQIAAKDAWRPKITASVLPNPILNLTENGTGDAAEIEKIYAPEVMAAGDQVFVKVKPVDGAAKYTVYVSAYADGKGAQPVGKPEKDPSITFVRGLQPAIPMYFFASYTDKDGKESKPSPARETVLKDEFPFK